MVMCWVRDRKGKAGTLVEEYGTAWIYMNDYDISITQLQGQDCILGLEFRGTGGYTSADGV